MLVSGTPISMTDTQQKSTDIKASNDGTTITVDTAGRYLISYNVNTSAPVLTGVGTRLMINGAANDASVLIAALPQTHFSNEILVNLKAGSTVSLQMFGIATATTLLPGSAGATLSIIRLS